MTEAPTRRDRLRADTMREITGTARRILVEEGAQAVTLRAIAREMGMTAPALYRYYDSHHELLRHVCADLFTELCDRLEAATAIASPPGEDDEPSAKLIAACREFRRWAFDHPTEFALIFGSPIPQLDGTQRDITEECAHRFGGLFARLFVQLWQKHPFPVPEPEEIAPALVAELERFTEAMEVPLPPGAALAFLQCWSRLYGTITMEVFGHLNFALTDTEPMFELMLSDLSQQVGMTYP